jgi:hypothetical protein
VTTPQELLDLAHNNLATADRVWVERGLHHNEGEVMTRIAQANAQALLALGVLIHEYLHPQPQAMKTQTPAERQAHLDSLIAEAEQWGMGTSEIREALADELQPREDPASPASPTVSSSATRLISSEPRLLG